MGFGPRRLKSLLLLCLIVFLAGCSLLSKDSAGDRDSFTDHPTDVKSVTESPGEIIRDPENLPFEIRMLDVGQGLALLIRAGQKYMMYDGGGRESSSYVVSYLRQHDIRSLDYIIASHYDEDHIAGLVGVLNTTTIGTVITPDYRADSQIYQSFRKMLKKNGAKEDHPKVGDTYSLGDAEIEVLGPASYDYENENSRSIVVKISYGHISCIITGDAEYDAENDMIRNEKDKLNTNLYIVGHHGSSSSSSPAFVKAMSPEYALISVGKDNPYDHPTAETLTTLSENNCEIFRTDQEGEITAASDGDVIVIDSSSGSAAKGYGIERNRNPAEKSNDDLTSYVLNTRSKLFHEPDCPSVSKMSDHNKKEYKGTRDDLLSMGYSPCGFCKP